jgi:hypothetical protein
MYTTHKKNNKKMDEYKLTLRIYNKIQYKL